MSKGALRLALTNAIPLVSLPQDVSIEPAVSSVSYGLTLTNSLLIVWENVCVERSDTNRVNASIELFDSGDKVVRFGDDVTTIPAPLPEGWVGEGQSLAWATNAFPEFAGAIVTNGYEGWVTSYVGINEQNGRYKASITLETLPMSGPCYLVCGPYKVIVKTPGVYSFPLEVFEHYTARTYPTAVPLSVEYDDGYRSEEDAATMQAPASRSRAARAAALTWDPYMLDIYMSPYVHLTPSTFSVSEASGAQISIWCNMANVTRRFFSSISGMTHLVFGGASDLEIEDAQVDDLVEVFLSSEKGTTSGIISIYDDRIHHCEYCSESSCPCGSSCLDSCGCHTTDTNGVTSCIGLQ